MKRRGFSLVEVVISLVLISLLIGMTYSAITVSVTNTTNAELERLALHEVQNLETLMRADNVPAALNLYINCDTSSADADNNEIAEVNDENHRMIFEKDLPTTQTGDGAYSNRLIFFYDRYGALLGWRATGAIDGAAFTITIYSTSGTNLVYKAETTGGKTLYESKDSNSN